MVRIINNYLPEFIILENVSTFYSSTEKYYEELED